MPEQTDTRREAAQAARTAWQMTACTGDSDVVWDAVVRAVLAVLPAPPASVSALAAVADVRVHGTLADDEVAYRRGWQHALDAVETSALHLAPAPPVVDEGTECGRCEQVRPVSWTDDDEVTYCEECVNAIMTDLHADIARLRGETHG